MAAAAEAKEGLVKLGLPKGRMQEGVFKLLSDAGVSVKVTARAYRPTISLPNMNVKLLKPQNILLMIAAGTRDIGFAGYDWVVNLGLENDVVEVLDTEMDQVRLVFAAPDVNILDRAKKAGKNGPKVLVASEYEKVTLEYMKRIGINGQLVRTFGATEVLPPEDADAIVDNTSTGATLKANGLTILDTVMKSSTRMYASKKAMADPEKKKRIETLVMLLRSVLHARAHKMVEFNVPESCKDKILPTLPSMRAPTVSKLDKGQGIAVRIAVKKGDIPSLLPRLKLGGCSDIVVSEISMLMA